ncbi:MAG: hypothetical protein NTZ64_01250 [Polaromonas sp.]|nr:hypothetical protein [Polaromonas sp.]
MNEYCKHKVRQFHASFKERSFDQDDVALLIVLTRDYTKKGSIFRELGDFLAHPSEKDRGLVLNSVKSAASSFEKDCRRYFEEPDFKPPTFKGLGTLEELITDILIIFNLAGFPQDQIKEDDANFRDFVFCIIFLLSTFKIKNETRLFDFKVDYSHSLTLFISYESKNFPRHFATLPVLFLGNVWINCTSLFGARQNLLKNHIARRFEEGFLAAIRYEDDLQKKILHSKDFERGNAWPLPELR